MFHTESNLRPEIVISEIRIAINIINEGNRKEKETMLNI